MQKELSKKLMSLSMLLGTVAILSYVVMHLNKSIPEKPAKNIVKKEQTEKPNRKGLIREALIAHQNELENCYQNFLLKKPEVAEGSVTVSWLIDAEGSVLSTQLAQSEFQDESLASCILEKVAGVKFGPPPERQTTQLAHKFRFKRRAAASLAFE